MKQQHVMAKFDQLEESESTIDLVIRYDTADGAYEFKPMKNGKIVDLPTHVIVMTLENIKIGSYLQGEGL